MPYPSPVQDGPAPRRKLQPQVILLGLVSLLNDSASEMIYPLLPIFITSVLGASPTIVGLIEGAADGLASVLKYVAGRISDRLPRRKPFIATGYALAAGSRALIAAAGSWVAVLTARLIDRTGKGIRSAPRDAMIADVTPSDQRGRAFGFHRAMDHTGAMVGPLLATALMTGLHVPLRHMFYISVIPGAIAVLLLIFLLKEPEREIGVAPKPPLPVASSTQVATGSAPLHLPGSFWTVITAIGLFSLANSSDAFLLLLAHDTGVSTAMLPLLWSAHHVVKSLLSTHVGGLSDRMQRRHLVAFGWFLYALTYFMFPYAKSVTLFFALFVFYALPFVFAEGAERALITDLVPPETRGRSFGVFYLVTGMGVLIGSGIFGAIYQYVSHRAAFNVGAGLAIVAAIVVLQSPARRRAAV